MSKKKLTFKRGEGKLNADYLTKDIYKHYLDTAKTPTVDAKTFSRVWTDFIDVRLQMVIFENVPLTMPGRLGEIFIRVGKRTNRILDDGTFKFKVHWGDTKKKWAEMYPDKTPEEILEIPDKPLVAVSNETTEGKGVYWRWEKLTCNHRNHSVYRIRMTRKWSRMLSSYVQQLEKIPYYESNG